jgi:hypothetical protein
MLRTHLQCKLSLITHLRCKLSLITHRSGTPVKQRGIDYFALQRSEKEEDGDARNSRARTLPASPSTSAPSTATRCARHWYTTSVTAEDV